MEDMQDILDRHTDVETDELDLRGVTDEMAAAVEAAVDDGFRVDPIELILINERFTNTMVDYLGRLFLDLAEELGALPAGREVDEQNFDLFKEHARVSAVYELARTKEAIEEARSGLIVPDATRPVDLSAIRGDDA